MSSPRTTRRYAILLYAAVCFLVLGGLAWASYSAIELERGRLERAADQANLHDLNSYEEKLATALWRMESFVQPMLARELGRPFTDYLPYYTPQEVLLAPTRIPIKEGVQVRVPSPLLTEMRSMPAGRVPWMLLHFQGSDNEGWTSPQLPDGPDTHAPAWEVPSEKRRRGHWLTALSRMYDPHDVAKLLDDSNRVAMRYAGRLRDEAVLPAGASHPEEVAPLEETSEERRARSEADYVRRGERARRLEEQNVPLQQCVQERVFAVNLPTGTDAAAVDDNCVCMSLEGVRMAPAWLELTGSGESQLAFIRKWTVDGSLTYYLQGVLVDWPRLRAALEEEVADLFPGAEIIPVRPGDPIPDQALPSLMTMLSARLQTEPPARLQAAAISTDLKMGLSAAWLAALLALAAIGYGAMKYVTLAERRMRFVSAVTHELRTPLTTFQLYTDLLADANTDGGGRQAEYIDTLRGESKRLSRLVENVLAYSRMGRQTPVLHQRTVRPAALLESARAATAETCAAAGKTIVVTNGCPADLTIDTDAEFVVQILSNLIENACKYGGTADDGRIWLTAREEPGRGVVLEVEDPGSGIAPHDRRDVFRAFRRGENGQQAATQGIGLGLTLSRHWAKCLGGDLSVKRGTHNAGRYACFILSLPGHTREVAGLSQVPQ